MKLTEVLKTMVDDDTAVRFHRRAAAAGCNTGEFLRDMVFMMEHGMTHGEYVAQSRRRALLGPGPSACEVGAK